MKKVLIIMSVIGSIITALLLNGPTMLSNAEELPSAFLRMRDSLLGWYYDDASWSGRWSSNPQTYVNVEDMQLADVDLRLEIYSKNGQIDGTIATRKICAAIPLFNFVLISGSIKGNRAEIVAFDTIGGRNQDFAKLTLERDGVILIVTPNEGEIGWFPSRARIARHSDSDQDKEFNEMCSKEREAFHQERRRIHGTFPKPR